MGNLTKDPELRYTPSGIAVVNLRLAVNRKYKDKSGEPKEETCFVTVTAWDKQAEVCNQYLQKGRLIMVEGRLQSRQWETNDGQKRNTIDVRAERVQFLGSRSSSTSDGSSGNSYSSNQPSEASLSKTENISWDEEEKIA